MKGLLGKIEFIVIGVFALIFVLWTVSKCSSNKEKLQEQAAAEAREDSIANAAKQPATTTALPSVAGATSAASPQPDAATSATSTQTTAQPAAGQNEPASQTTTAAGTASKEPQLSKLYVTIDKLKVRKTPGLKGESLGELKLFDEVYYMNEVTDSTYKISLGKEVADEPYVKIKTKRGTVGWVYGAGVHYVKKKRSGTLE